MIAYCIRNIINGKAYIGISTKPDVRWGWHRNAADRNVPLPLYKAMNKYGKERFTFEAVACARTWEDLCEVEKALIAQYDTFGTHGYNSTAGGDGMLGVKASDERRANQRLATLGNKRGIIKTEQHRERLRAALRNRERRPESIAKTAAAHVGMKHSSAAKAKMSAARMGRRLAPEHRAKLAAILAKHLPGHVVSDETRAKIGAANRGRKRSAEVRAKMSEARRGMPMPEETKRKLSLAKTGKIGHKNSPETRAKIGASHRGRKQSDQTVAKRVAALIGQKRSPEARARIRAGILASRARKTQRQMDLPL